MGRFIQAETLSAAAQQAAAFMQEEISAARAFATDCLDRGKMFAGGDLTVVVFVQEAGANEFWLAHRFDNVGNGEGHVGHHGGEAYQVLWVDGRAMSARRQTAA